MPPTAPEHEEMKRLLQESIALSKDTNRLLREMRRNAILGFVVKIVIWLIVLGVPLFFLSSYLGPLLDAFASASSGQGLQSGLLGFPSVEEVTYILEQYRGAQ